MIDHFVNMAYFMFSQALGEIKYINLNIGYVVDNIVKDLDLEPNEIQQIMKNKITWRKFVSAASTIPSKDDK